MIFGIIIILALMIIDFPFTVTPAIAFGLILGLDAIRLGASYILATLFSGIFFYYTMKKYSKRFKTWKIINRYKNKSTFFSIFLANILTHNFDTAASAGDQKINIFTTILALTTSNLIYFFTVWIMTISIMPFLSTFIMKIIIPTIIVSIIWTAIAHPISYRLGFGW